MYSVVMVLSEDRCMYVYVLSVCLEREKEGGRKEKKERVGKEEERGKGERGGRERESETPC